MASLLVAMNKYNTGYFIEYMNYDSSDHPAVTERAGENLSSCYDEVYIVDISPVYEDFIEEIRKHGRKL